MKVFMANLMLQDFRITIAEWWIRRILISQTRFSLSVKL